MEKPRTTTELIDEINDPEYQNKISEGLNQAHKDAFTRLPSFRIGTDRMIIFSDLHKGARNDADDFRRCERAYNSALGYYYALGYWLIELGDVEELWEERPEVVVKKYERTLRLSAKFHIDPERRGSRYTRLWGNHDDHWNLEDRVEALLKPIYCPEGIAGLTVHSAVRIQVLDDKGDAVGELFLAHGHQGTFESDRAGKVSRLFVRYIWRPIQRVTNKSFNTPAKDWVLRQKHNLAMYRWAAGLNRPDFIFIAGHTHKPVFLAKSKSDMLADRLLSVDEALRANPDNAELKTQLAELSAELEWTRAESQEDTGKDGIVSQPKACYFNTGCAAFLDGDITGIELVGDEIRLVRWPDESDAPKPHVLASVRLSTLFSRVPA